MRLLFKLLFLLVSILPEKTIHARSSLRSHTGHVVSSKKLGKQQVSSSGSQKLSAAVNPVDVKSNRTPELKFYQSRTYTIRVLLDTTSGSTTWEIASHHGSIIKDRANGSILMRIDAKCSIQAHAKGWMINGRLVSASTITITPHTHDELLFNTKRYQGSFICAKDGDRAVLINALELEDYVTSVLRTESWPGWPLEVNKVMAIVARTYALATILQSKRTKALYHIKNTNHHQTYQGKHDDKTIKLAVEQTRGMFLSYEDKPILAMFDSCCGGIIPAQMHTGCDFEKAPYLARTYACRHCKSLKIYSWNVEMMLDEFARYVANDCDHHGIKDVKITQKDKAGIAESIAIKTQKKTYTLSARKLYSSIPQVKSFCFDLTKKSQKVIIKGRGYGHHLGLCQWGAREMVRDGWHYKRILSFYYPNTTIMNLS